MSISFSKVSFTYGDGLSIDNLSFEVADGCITALAGATGSGKSTLLKLAAGLLRPTSGEICVDQKPCWQRCWWGALRRDPQLPWRLGYVMQRPERQLFAPTVLEDVAFGPKNGGASPQEATLAAQEALELLSIAHLASRSPFELSGGQQRLVAIAGVLAMKPANLVLDEPLSALDPQGRTLVEQALCQLISPHGSLLMVCHDMDAIGRIASQMIVLDQGTLAMSGPAAHLFASAEKLRRLGLGIPTSLAFAQELEVRTGVSLGDPLTQDALVSAILAHCPASETSLGSCPSGRLARPEGGTQ